MKEFHVVAVKDELTNTFLQPTFAEDEREIERIFTYQINNTPIWKENPSDFSLYHLGTFDQETGELKKDVYKMIGGMAVWRKEKEKE